jgi:hypothetical protein
MRCLNLNILKQIIGINLQDMKIDDNIEIQGTTPFKYLGSIFIHSKKCKEELLNRIEQDSKATGTLNSLLWGKIFH